MSIGELQPRPPTAVPTEPLGLPGAQELEVMKLTFDSYDTDGGGTVDTEELTAVLRDMGASLTPAQVREIIKEVDYNQAMLISQSSSP